VLDPTCGSGAFLFAALNILEPLYEACLGRMTEFLNDETVKHDAAKLKFTAHGYPLLPGGKFEDFAHTLEHVAQHVSPQYFIYKSIILQNLFGVDIMPEAVEICKLRLFLKLAAQVEPNPNDPNGNLGIEPLPDIDFNICAGNTLVGYATLAAVQNSMFGRNYLERIRKADEQIRHFRERQSQTGDLAEQREDKEHIRARLSEIREKLDISLFTDYGARDLTVWKKSHQPFHWYVEFNSIIQSGGFNVIIGNPPWVEFAKIQKDYKPKGMATSECNNLWAFVVERSYDLLARNGRVGLIVPMSLVCTERMLSIQKIVRDSGISWLSNFESDSNPGQLFDGVKQNVTILIGCHSRESRVLTTRLYRFFQEYRDFVFYSVEFVQSDVNQMPFGFPKVSTEQEIRLLSKIFKKSRLAAQMTQLASAPVLVHRIAHYYIKCFNFVPYFRSERDGIKKSEDYKEYFFKGRPELFVAVINSTTFYFYWQVFFDAFKAGKFCVESFPFANETDEKILDGLTKAAKTLMGSMKSNASRLKAEYAATGKVEYDQFYPRNSKSILDEIDRELAQHYGFTAEELDFIINYDIKYRLGRDTESDEE
jgi:hypothetical protein